MRRVLAILLSFWFVLIAICSWAQGPPAGPVPSTFFGMNVHGDPVLYPTVSIGTLGKESAAEWGWIEPNAPVGSGCPGTVNCTHTYNWTTLDGYLSASKNHGLTNFMWTWDESPPWATSNVGCHGSNPVQCTGPITDWVDYDAFVRALVTRYNVGSSIGTISIYETGNEEDYSGTPTQYAIQAERFYNDIHAINPSALFVGPGKDNPTALSAFQSGGDFDQWFSAWKAIPGNHAHLDAVTFHGYAGGDPLALTGTCQSSTSWQGQAASSGFVNCVKGAISRNSVTTFSGGSPQIWDTEGSWGQAVNSTFTIQQKIAYVGEFLLLNWAYGVSRQDWYAWDNSTFGTLCTGGGTSCTPTAVTIAYQQIYNWMVGSTMTSACSASGTVWTCGLTAADGTQELAVWNTAGASTYAPASQYSKYKDLAGNTTSLSGSIAIGIQPLLLVGGTLQAQAPSPPTGLTASVQ